MARWRSVIPFVSVASAGVGVWVGTSWERNRSTSPRDSKYILPMPSVEAASHVIPAAPPGGPGSSLASSPASRTMEIMKYGYPGLNNFRAFDDYVLYYDRRHRSAQWVFEHLTNERVQRQEGIDRTNSEFKQDEVVHPYFRATNDDYKNSGYDRGHLAAAANHRWAQKAMDQTFTLSNIAPQVGKGFNRDGWSTLEKFTRALTRRYTNVYVCTGPLYLPRKEADGKLYVKYEVIGPNHVSVPTHFFKVMVCEAEDGALDLLSFIMPNQILPNDLDIKKYLVPVDSIERAAGLLLFDKIPKNKFRKINGLKL